MCIRIIRRPHTKSIRIRPGKVAKEDILLYFTQKYFVLHIDPYFFMFVYKRLILQRFCNILTAKFSALPEEIRSYAEQYGGL